MPVCLTCGEEDFDLVDGLYFCTCCMTQSQHAREEEAEAFVPEASTVPRNMKEIREKKVKKEKKEKDQGRPWQTHEALTVVFREQIKALISLGADPMIKDIALRIWVLYLQRCGIAFTSLRTSQEAENSDQNETQTTPTKKRRRSLRCGREQVVASRQRLIRNRDKYLGTIDRPVNLPVTVRASKMQNLTSKAQNKPDNLQSDEEGEGVGAALRDHVEDDDEDAALMKRLVELELQDRANQDPNHKCDDDGVLVVGNYKNHETRRLDHSGLRTLLALACLALRYTNPLTSITQVVRWTEQGKIPFYLAFRLLPPDMKFFASDIIMFLHAVVPSPIVLHRSCRKLARFLDLQDFPPINISALASKYIVELDLPMELHVMVRQLISEFRPKSDLDVKLHGCLGQHLTAMSFIIISLKLLLRLDDKTERTLSDYGRKLQSILPLSYKLFIWEDWVSHTDRRLLSRANTTVPSCLQEIRRCSSVTNLLSSLSDLKGSRSTHAWSTSKDAPAMAKSRDSMQHLLFLLQKKLKAATHTKSENEESSQETPANFSKTSLRYLKEKDFLETYHEHGLSDITVLDHVSDSELESSAIFNSYDPAEDLLSMETHRHQFSQSQAAVRDTLLKSQPITRQKMSEVREVLDNFEKPEVGQYWSHMGSIEEFPLSFQWLMQVCSDCIGCTRQKLANVLYQYELVCVSSDSELKRADRFLKSFKMKQFFE